MSTKYILHGGNAQDINTKNERFFREIINGSSSSVNILLVQFAAIAEKHEVYKDRHMAQFHRVQSKKELQFEVAQKEKFVEQLKWADVVYLCGSSGGGATERLLGVLKQFDNLKHMFDGKIVAGESAGANCLAVHCYSKSSGILSCLGLVPVDLIVHYQEGDEEALQGINGGNKCLYLKNYQFQVF